MKRIPFTAAEELFGRDGIWNTPVDRKKRKQRSVQINIEISKKKIEAMAKLLNKLSSKPGWGHEHFEFWDDDNMVRFHVIVRENEKEYDAHLKKWWGLIGKHSGKVHSSHRVMSDTPKKKVGIRKALR